MNQSGPVGSSSPLGVGLMGFWPGIARGSIGTIARVAAKFGVYRRVVREALVNAVPAKHH